MICQCPDAAYHHAPGLCENSHARPVRDTRNGAELWVCWDCIRSHHQRLDEEDS